tara:strand:- start:758 stop:1540 length:783 start_codon:yes stop_codon:yes gene_type:complete
MGILNITPDSFSDGGKYLSASRAIDRAFAMVDNGADIIDIGGESTRPGSDFISKDEELQRIVPVIQEIRNQDSEILISIDTYKSDVAEIAIDLGANIVNDISGLTFDQNMSTFLSGRDIPVIIMHINGKPKTMQINPIYDDLINDINSFFKKQIIFAQSNGIDRDNIILDPGIGFGKTFNHNLTIINNLKDLCSLGHPIMVGTSRKAFIGDILDAPHSERVEGTIASVVASVINGANIVRVHDVKEIKKAIMVTEKILAS